MEYKIEPNLLKLNQVWIKLICLNLSKKKVIVVELEGVRTIES